MIKFKYIIHKKTELIITYDEWLKYYKEHSKVELTKISHFLKSGIRREYKPEDMLFSDEFEIVYETEFTTLELIQLYANSGDLRFKLKQVIDQRHNLKRKYGRIEV